MLVPHMNNKIIIPLDPLLANILTPRKWAVNSLGRVNHLIVSVECLFRFERGWSGAARHLTSVRARGASVWTTLRG